MTRVILLYVLSSGIALASSVTELAKIDIQFAENFKEPLGTTVRFNWHTDNTAKFVSKLAQYNGIDTKLIGNGQLQITVSREASYQGTSLKKHSLASFVIDIDEPDTQVFLNAYEFDKQEIKLKNIRDYVYQYMSYPTYAEGFNIASSVARTKRGDCTEYAMLTTALARFLGLPARYMVGTIFVQEEEQINAYGHAWTEVLIDSSWQILDAAMYNPSAELSTVYLPYGELDNEGPGFGWSLFVLNAFAPTHITHFENIF